MAYGEIREKIITRKDGTPYTVWQADYKDCDGKRRNTSFRTKKEALAALRKAQNEVEQGIHTANSETLTLGTALDAWLADCQRRHEIGDLAGHTLSNYRYMAERYITPALGTVKLNRLTALHCQDFVDTLSTKQSSSTVSLTAAVLKVALKFAVKRKWLRRSPLTDEPLKLPRQKTRDDCPTKQELLDLLDAVANQRPGEHLYTYQTRLTLITLAIYTGMRRGEIAGLLWENVDLVNGVIHVRHSLSPFDGLRGPKTKYGIRQIPMPPLVREALQLIGERSSWPRTGYVFRKPNGRAITGPEIYANYFKPAMRRAGLVKDNGTPKFRFHALRHGFASLLHESGTELVIAARILGHSKTTMTLHYTHAMDQQKKGEAAMQMIGRALNPELRQICDNTPQGAESVE
jgi:integrase